MSKPVIIVVGAGPGVGMATARRFAAAGYDIGLIARDAGRVGALAEELSDAGAQVGWAAADAGDEAALTGALQRMTEHTGRVDVLLHNAVAAREAPLIQVGPEDLLADLRVGTAGLLTAVRAVLPLLVRQHTGTILATGGGAADRPYGDLATLSVTKAALRSVVQVLARELKPEGVHAATVTVYGSIAPDTPFAPDVVAGLYWDLVQETAGPPAAWRTVVELRRPPA